MTDKSFKKEKPEVYAIARDGSDWRLTRRDFLTAAAVGSAAILGGCAHNCKPCECPEIKAAETQAAPTPVVAPAPPAVDTSTAGVSAADASALMKDCTRMLAHTGEVLSLAFAPDGKALFSGSDDESIKIWSLPDATIKKTLVESADPETPNHIFALAVSPDGSTLVSGSGDETIKLWNLPIGRVRRTLTEHTGSVYDVAISPDGKTLVSGSYDRSFRVWSLPEGKLLKFAKPHDDWVRSVAISPDKKLFATGSYDDTIKLWSLPAGAPLKTLKGHADDVNALVISPDGKTLVSGSSDGRIMIWSLPDGNRQQTLSLHEDTVDALAISPDGKTLASGSQDQTVKIWSLKDGTLLHTLEGHKSWVHALAISPDSKTLASGGSGSIMLWDLPSGEPIKCVWDMEASNIDLATTFTSERAVQFEMRDHSGARRKYTLPCGVPLPADAACTCNCVPGQASPPALFGTGGGDTHCNCVPVYVEQ
jgi:WD40 repeat protein